MKRLRSSVIYFLGCFLLTACDQGFDNDESNVTRVNTFAMTLNDNLWTPSEMDPCTSTFRCEMWELGENRGYTIAAYKDPNSIADLTSENFFRLQLINVNETGDYIVDGTFEAHFDTYARFIVNVNGEIKIYQNKENTDLFKVKVERFYPKETSSIVGIKGSFEGTLYNLEDPLDSIRIDQGEFDFKKSNWTDFNQCNNN